MYKSKKPKMDIDQKITLLQLDEHSRIIVEHGLGTELGKINIKFLPTVNKSDVEG